MNNDKKPVDTRSNDENKPDDAPALMPEGIMCSCGGRLQIVENGAKCVKCGTQNITMSGNAGIRIS